MPSAIIEEFLANERRHGQLVSRAVYCTLPKQTRRLPPQVAYGDSVTLLARGQRQRHRGVAARGDRAGHPGASGCVARLNVRWGTGKTTIVTTAHLQNKYYNVNKKCNKYDVNSVVEMLEENIRSRVWLWKTNTSAISLTHGILWDFCALTQN